MESFNILKLFFPLSAISISNSGGKATITFNFGGGYRADYGTRIADSTSFDFTISLLADNGIYVRDCSDKIGLDGQFVRVASRTLEENKLITAAFRGKFK